MGRGSVFATRGRVRRSAVVVLTLAFRVVALGPGVPQAPAALDLPLGFIDEPVATMSLPTALAFTPDGRLLVTTKAGTVRVIKNGQNLLALNISSKTCSDIERGVVGLAVDPAFTTNHFIYLFYTFKKFGSCPTSGSNTPVNRVSRFVLPDSNVINVATETVLIDNIANPGGYHGGGDLKFGKNGFLYVSTGDGGCDYARDHLCGASNRAARDENVLVGKILRITRDGGIPASNPYQDALSARCNVTGSAPSGFRCRETFAWGLRNPFRMAFDPNGTSTRFHINDVGQAHWEEIDLGQAGADYGWNVREGHCKTGSATNCGPPPEGMTNPIFDYGQTTGCKSIVGGAFVPNGIGWPASYTGKYLFADYVCGGIFRLDPSGPGYVMTPIFTGAGTGTFVSMTFGPSPYGQSLYYTSFNAGIGPEVVRRISFSSDGTPVAGLAAAPTAGLAPLTVDFDGSSSADPNEDPLTYLWDFGDGSTDTTTGSSTSHTYTVDDVYSASLRVRDPAGHVSAPAVVSIVVGNEPPVPVIEAPVEGSTFSVGQTITLTGSASDGQDGSVPASRLTWTVLRHHADHTHPYFGPASGNNLTITGPSPEDLAAATNSYLEIRLTATDSGGLTTTVSRIVQPKKVLLTFKTDPKGLRVQINGIGYATPLTITSWQSWGILVNTRSPQGSAIFVSWSDGGAQEHTIVTPATSKTYTARFIQPA